MSEVAYLSSAALRLGAGKFDASRRYLTKTTASGSFGVAAGKTLNMAYVSWTGTTPAVTQYGIAWRFSVNGFVKQPTTSVWGGTFPTLGFNATVTSVNAL